MGKDLPTEPLLERILDEHGHRYTACGNVIIVYTDKDPTLESLQRGADAIRRIASRYPDGLAMMVLVPEHASPPSSEARHAIRDNYRKLSTFMRIVVVVVEGSGFVASAKRSVMTLINLAAPLPYPTKVVASVREAAATIINSLGPALDRSLTQRGIVDAASFARLDSPDERSAARQVPTA